MAQKYVWWLSPQAGARRPELVIAQLLQMGTYDDEVMQVASLLDLAATKLKVLLQRVEAKEYRDVAALVDRRVPRLRRHSNRLSLT